MSMKQSKPFSIHIILRRSKFYKYLTKGHRCWAGKEKQEELLPNKIKDPFLLDISSENLASDPWKEEKSHFWVSFKERVNISVENERRKPNEIQKKKNFTEFGRIYFEGTQQTPLSQGSGLSSTHPLSPGPLVSRLTQPPPKSRQGWAKGGIH